MPAHLKYGGSTAERTLNCPGWHAQVEAIPALPGAVESKAATEGTALHKCMEIIEKGGKVSIGTIVEKVKITRELVSDMLLPAAEARATLAEKYGETKTASEIFVRLDDDIGGTIDFIGKGYQASTGRKVVIVGDYKFGRGIMVSPYENAQTLFYGACASDDELYRQWFVDADVVVMAIIQPADHDGEILKVWETTPQVLDEFYTHYMDAVQLADTATVSDTDLLNPGSWCTFCPVAAICPKKTGMAEIPKRFPAESPTLVDLGRYLDVIPEIEAWIRSVQKLAHEAIERGDRIPGHKLVNKRGRRVYTDEEAVEALVRRSRKVKHEETHTSTLLSPAQMEKLYKEKGLDFSKIEEHIAMHSSGTTIVPESDKRQAIPSVNALRALVARTG